jgi:hypothetical protein
MLDLTRAAHFFLHNLLRGAACGRMSTSAGKNEQVVLLRWQVDLHNKLCRLVDISLPANVHQLAQLVVQGVLSINILRL